MKYNTTSVDLTMEELIFLASNMEIKIGEIEKGIDILGDRNGYWEKEKEKCEIMLDKFKNALEIV